MTSPSTLQPAAQPDEASLRDDPAQDEIDAMNAEADAFRNPAPPPIPVRGRFYPVECEHCGWVGSSEQLGSDEDDISCPVCCRSVCGDAPSEADQAKHGEAVMTRIVAAEARALAASALAERVPALEAALRPFTGEDVVGLSVRARVEGPVQYVHVHAPEVIERARAVLSSSEGGADA